jgi:gamma-glutamylcyclotransferase (GGCT)/AIG2-like uncharacterized protein YtfP
MHIFTYGSLMFQEVWTRVVRGDYRCRPATLPGYQRKAVKKEVYPVALRGRAEDRIDGVVYFDVEPDDVDRLDVFEGIYYRRLVEVVFLSSDTTIEAGVYVLHPDFRSIIAEKEWDAEQFRQSGLPRFLSSYLGFHATASDR